MVLLFWPRFGTLLFCNYNFLHSFSRFQVHLVGVAQNIQVFCRCKITRINKRKSKDHNCTCNELSFSFLTTIGLSLINTNFLNSSHPEMIQDNTVIIQHKLWHLLFGLKREQWLSLFQCTLNPETKSKYCELIA